jgi:hypothetical protein
MQTVLDGQAVRAECQFRRLHLGYIGTRLNLQSYFMLYLFPAS